MSFRVPTQATDILSSDKSSDLLFMGDLNWEESMDGEVAPLTGPEWADFWTELRWGDPGYTYNPKTNGNLGKARLGVERGWCEGCA